MSPFEILIRTKRHDKDVNVVYVIEKAKEDLKRNAKIIYKPFAFIVNTLIVRPKSYRT